MKKYVKIREILFKNWKWLFENTNQTPQKFLLKFLFIYLLKITNKNQLFAQTNKLRNTKAPENY